ncbi:MAG: hypothetical protein NC433_05730 [Clostridiales bacterium]|nr:hypothetical protein [Clostridiales bacterium]
MEKQIMGVDVHEIRRQCKASILKCDSNSPIEEFETLEPCIKGGEEIISNPELLQFFRTLYTRERNNG